MIEAETIDAASTIKLLASREGIYPRQTAIHVFLDNARYRHAKPVQDWLAQPGRHFARPSRCLSQGKTGRSDARGIAEMMRLGHYKPALGAGHSQRGSRAKLCCRGMRLSRTHETCAVVSSQTVCLAQPRVPVRRGFFASAGEKRCLRPKTVEAARNRLRPLTWQPLVQGASLKRKQSQTGGELGVSPGAASRRVKRADLCNK